MSECPTHDWMCDCKDSTIQWVDREHQHPVLKGPGWFCMGCLAEFVSAKQVHETNFSNPQEPPTPIMSKAWAEYDGLRMTTLEMKIITHRMERQLAAMSAELRSWKNWHIEDSVKLSTLLRAIHRDCGEYQAEVGTEKAVADALLVVQATVSAHAKCIEERDAVQDERNMLIETLRGLNKLSLCGRAYEEIENALNSVNGGGK